MGRLTEASNWCLLSCGMGDSSREDCPMYANCMTRLMYDKLKHYKVLEEAGRLIELPCDVGDTVYRICPKCNDRHDGSCKNCAWASCLSNSGCTTYGLWNNGQYPPEKCTIVPYEVFWNYFPDLMRNLGRKVFLTKEEAEAKLKELEVQNE